MQAGRSVQAQQSRTALLAPSSATATAFIAEVQVASDDADNLSEQQVLNPIITSICNCMLACDMLCMHIIVHVAQFADGKGWLRHILSVPLFKPLFATGKATEPMCFGIRKFRNAPCSAAGLSHVCVSVHGASPLLTCSVARHVRILRSCCGMCLTDVAAGKLSMLQRQASNRLKIRESCVNKGSVIGNGWHNMC